jgi:hypothetical protein
MSRRELQSSQHLPGLLGCSAVQLNDANAEIVPQMIDRKFAGTDLDPSPLGHVNS